MPVTTILFDIDGTLADSNDLHVEAWERAFADAGYKFDRQTLHDQIGKGTDNYVPALLPDLDEAAVKALGAAHGRIFKADYLDRVQLFPGAHDLLAEAHRRGQAVVLASSASREEVAHYIDRLDARDLVDTSTSVDDVERSKPAPDIFATALKKAGSPPERAIAVGDTPYDVEAAGQCGMRAIGLLSGGFAEDALRGSGAVAIYVDVAALLAGYDRSPLAA